MFDGIKIGIYDGVTHSRLLNNPALTFIAGHKYTGEVPTAAELKNDKRLSSKTANHKHLVIVVHDSGLIYISGSLHYYFNNGVHNYNQYSIAQVKQTLQLLQLELGIDLETARIHNLEFGANLITPFNPDVLINNLIVHKNSLFNKFDIKDSNGRETLWHVKQYGLKFYNKGLHFKNLTDQYNLRFEIKCRKMEFIRKGNIFLADLVKPDFIELCKARLIDAFNEVMIKEPINRPDLSSKEYEFYLEYSNPNYWTELDKNKRYKKKERLNELLEKYSTDRIKDKTRKILFDTLQNISENENQKGDLLTALLTPERRPFDHLDIVSISHQSIESVNRCITCGRDISRQKKGSKFCSEKTFGRDAKKCRNIESNPRNNFKNKLEIIQRNGVLFDILPFMRTVENIGPSSH